MLTICRALASCASSLTLLFAALPASAQNQHWIRQFGTVSMDESHAAAPDGSGGVYVSGETLGNLGGPYVGGFDAWLARYDSRGIRRWIRQLGSYLHDGSNAAAADGSGGVYVGGYTDGDLGGPHVGGEDAWLAHFDLAGNQLWVRHLGTSADDAVTAAALDGSGGVYVTGWTMGSLGGPSAGFFDAWLARYDSAGNQLWVRQLGTSLADLSFAAAADGSGGVFIGGRTLGSLGGPSAGDYDAWLARYDGAGNQLWVRQFGTSQFDAPNAAAGDSGGVYLSGVTEGSLGAPSAGFRDAWLARYDGAGNRLWIRQLGTTAPDEALAVAPDDSNGVYVGGNTEGSLGGQLVGMRDAWLARYGPSLPLLCEPGLGETIACPCSNPASGPGRGCDNSSATGGASLSAAGDALLSGDSLEFTAQDEKPTALSVFLQGTTEVPQGIVFGQGVRCAGGTLHRLYVHVASGGAVTIPNVLLGDSSVSACSAALGDVILPGQSRWYSFYYRDPLILGGCPAASTFNTGPTMRAVWAP
jgi:catechol 2,3-dioxygenase-like lactoylglutathione lyase family enzyme